MISLDVKINPAPRRGPPPERGFGNSRRLRRLLIWLGMLAPTKAPATTAATDIRYRSDQESVEPSRYCDLGGRRAGAEARSAADARRLTEPPGPWWRRW